MEKQIMDQLEESGASKHLRSSTFECALFGTGIIKGPFAVDKEYANWDDEGEYSPTIKTVPQVKHVSCWIDLTLGMKLLIVALKWEKSIQANTGKTI